MNKLIASCNCNRKTGKEDRMVKAVSPTQHVEDLCIYCGYYVVYIDYTERDPEETYKRKVEGIDLQKDYLYNFGYPLGGRR